MRRDFHCLLMAGAVGLLPAILSGCARQASPSAQSAAIVRVEGSDTMVNIAQTWAEQYHQKHPDVSIQVLGGGSGVGVASLIDGNCDLANCSREMKPSEIQQAKAKHGVEPVEHIVGYDALAVCVHPNNPIQSISLEELAEIYGEGGNTTRWSQLGIDNGRHDRIVRISRQNSSGTYAYFREVVLGKRRDFKLGSSDMSGSKQVVALVAQTPGAVTYSGMGYVTPDVKMLNISGRKGQPTVAPTLENAKNGSYPITRSLLVYTVGEPTGATKAYLDWIKSPEGQKIVYEMGYVPAYPTDNK